MTDALISLANTFKEADLNPPKKIIVDRPTFDRLLSESIMLYNIDTKKAISKREFSLSDIDPHSRRSCDTTKWSHLEPEGEIILHDQHMGDLLILLYRHDLTLEKSNDDLVPPYTSKEKVL